MSALLQSTGRLRHGAFQSAASRRAPQHAAPQRVSRRRMHVQAVADLDPDNATIVVAGGGGVALAVTRKLKDMGSWVYMMQRHDDRRKEIENMMAFVVKGDALNREQVDKIFNDIEEVDAVVCSIGGTVANPAADGTGNINIIEAAAAKGCKKFVLVTSIGCGPTKDAPGEKTYTILAPVLLEKNKAEARLKELSDKMAYTIVRPGGLTNDPPSGAGVFTEDVTKCGAISRGDVAELVVKALFSSKTDNKELSCMDTNRMLPAGAPPPAAFEL